jgi:PAS domain S-box-containing protein
MTLTKKPKPAKSKLQSTHAAVLHSVAEERLKAKKKQAPTAAPTLYVEAMALTHELQVHQLELEMQNEELQQTRIELEALLAKYADLYDFAPVGYFTFAGDETILAVNLTGARLLGIERSRLLNRRFGIMVAPTDRAVFNNLMKKVFQTKKKETCEVELLKAGNQRLHVRIEAQLSEDGQECRAAVVDISDRQRVEQEREQLIKELQQSLATVKTLSGLLPICSKCKKIRDDQGYWNQIEVYIREHSNVSFTHGLCPDCLHRFYPNNEAEKDGSDSEEQ